MRPSSRLFVCVSLLVLLTASAFPQKRMCPKPPPSPYKHDGQIVTAFDGRGMRTTLEHPRPLGRGPEQFYMAATFVHQDPRRPATPTLDLILAAATPTTTLRAGSGLVFVLDGTPRAIGRNVTFKSNASGGAAKITLTYADAAALTGARKVSAKIGATEVELTNNHLEALREVVSQLAPSPGRWQEAGERLSAR